MFLKVKIGPIWAYWPTPPFVQNGRIVGPQIQELAICFFIKQTPFKSDFVQKIQIYSGPIGRFPIFQNSLQNGASNT